jgi:hypothetical protein
MVAVGPAPLSVLDLAPVASGSTVAQALRNSIELARHVERLGYVRHWVAEHHNMPGIASSAPAVLIAHLASVTSTLRVGSGGVMLPNHQPLVIAEHHEGERLVEPLWSRIAGRRERPAPKPHAPPAWITVSQKRSRRA